MAGRRQGGVRGGILRAVLLAFALRCLLPAGFMPDRGALAEGRLEVVLCSAHGPVAITLDAAGQPVEPDRDRAAGLLDCPFSAAVAKAFIAPGGSPGAVRFPSPSPPSPAPVDFRQGTTLAAPVGARAPPFPAGFR